ncbi:MAG: radical SAM protein [Bacteroidales bacterium]|nr:radical SAM protein [Bacteroidota bacterium]MBL6950401.1 radical SAM protein [Bacteroidales bacterium]
MKILLISPGSYDDINSQITRAIPYLFAKAIFSPHAIASVAALTPSEHEVEIHDEYIRGPVEEILPDKSYDIIGISITSNQGKHCQEIAAHCKRLVPNAIVVVGGIGVENLIHQNQEFIDIVFSGECEDTWPQFLEDFKKGKYQRIYKNISKPDMTRIPPPAWELIREDIPLYNAVSVQTTRGCPFDCSFCDVIYTYGRKPRSKTIEQVLQEIRKLYEMNVQMIFVADDNFVGNKKYAKELLNQLVELNNSFTHPIGFITQLDITIGEDDELLTLLANSNFLAVMIGIESVNENSLKNLNKQQNVRISIPDAVQNIQSYGIVVLAHMIIGADSDDLTVFQKTADFIREANIIHHICHPLSAPPGTKMWYDFKRQGRIISLDRDEITDKLDIISNIIPKQMTRVELFEGLADYWEKIYDPRVFMERAIAFITGIKQKPDVKKPGFGTLWKLRKMLFRVFTFFIFDVEKEHRTVFFTLLLTAKSKLSYLMPRIIYLYTSYLMDYKRSVHDIQVARDYVKWENENPDKVAIESSFIPIPDNIWTHAAELLTFAYHRICEKHSNKEIVFQSVVSAMLDFSDWFGNSFDSVGELQKRQIHLSCDRITDPISGSLQETTEELPENPPAGFTREILDALDNAIRYRNMYN